METSLQGYQKKIKEPIGHGIRSLVRSAYRKRKIDAAYTAKIDYRKGLFREISY